MPSGRVQGAGSALALPYLVDESRQDLVQVTDDAEVGELEEGALGSLLTTTMVLLLCMPARCWMAPEMPAARWSDGAHGLAGLAHLQLVRCPVLVGDGARCSGCAERVRGLADNGEAFLGADATPTGDDNCRVGEPERPVDTLGSREVILAPLAASLTATSTVSTDGDAAAAPRPTWRWAAW